LPFIYRHSPPNSCNLRNDWKRPCDAIACFGLINGIIFYDAQGNKRDSLVEEKFAHGHVRNLEKPKVKRMQLGFTGQAMVT
jgi:hypothetical protein